MKRNEICPRRAGFTVQQRRAFRELQAYHADKVAAILVDPCRAANKPCKPLQFLRGAVGIGRAVPHSVDNGCNRQPPDASRFGHRFLAGGADFKLFFFRAPCAAFRIAVPTPVRVQCSEVVGHVHRTGSGVL